MPKNKTGEPYRKTARWNGKKYEATGRTELEALTRLADKIAAAKRGEDVALDSGETIPNGELTYLPYRGRSYAYLSDTLPSARAAGLVGGVDLLYHEATFAAGDKALARQTGHSTTVQAAQVAEKAGARRLLIGHFSSRYKDESLLVEEARGIFAAAEAAVEGASYEIPLKREP